ncbi:MAG: metallophosphoesterase [Candidatus Gastranaerophilales bacterium]|nr:metallophosphoesterase [Candidatus Gastranaerophilales bacterium]
MTIFLLHPFLECMVNGVNYNQNYIYQQPPVYGYQSNPYMQGYYTAPNMQQPYNVPQVYQTQTLNTTQGYYSYQNAQMAPALTKDTYTPQNQAQSSARILPAKTNKAKLSLFFINDLHGHIDNMTNILGASKQFDKDAQRKGADTIKISAGDNYAGSDVKRNDLMIKFLEYIGVQASAVGNHEYDASTSTLCDTAKNSKIKFLAANVIQPQGSEFYNNIQKSIIIEQNGNRYGIVGLTPVDLETVASRSNALEGVKPNSLDETVRLAQAEIDKLRAQGVNKIILTSHLGIDKDKQIAPLLDGVDIIQGGHSHNLTPELKQDENIVLSKSGEPVIIVQAGENGK